MSQLLFCFYINISQRISLTSIQSQSRVRGVKHFIHTWYKTGFVSDRHKQTRRKDSAVNPSHIFSFSFDFPFFLPPFSSSKSHPYQASCIDICGTYCRNQSNSLAHKDNCHPKGIFQHIPINRSGNSTVLQYFIMTS